MNLQTSNSRRSFLTKGSMYLTLPFLPSLLPTKVQAASEKSANPVKRLLWMSMGHGHISTFGSSRCLIIHLAVLSR